MEGLEPAGRGRQIPSGEVEDVAVHLAEVDLVFGRGWVCVGHVAMLASPGDYFTLDLIGDPLVVVRGLDRIRVLSRVCLHRWASVVEGSGRTRLFTCPFHAWAYALDGTLVAAPFMEGAEGFDPGACRLPEARTEILEETGLIFVNLSKTGAAGVDPPKAFFEAGLCEAVAAGPHQDLAVALDWKTVMDEQPTDGAPVHVLAPNVRLHLDGGAARLELVYPNGPGAAMVRSLGLLGVTGEAVSLDEPSERIALYVDRRRQACG